MINDGQNINLFSRRLDHAGVVMESTGNIFVTNFNASTEVISNGGFRVWFSRASLKGQYNIGFADWTLGENASVHDAILTSEIPDDPQSMLVIKNLQEGWMPVQPNHIMLPSGKHRLYFWVHSKGVCRFLAAESTDGIVYTVINAYDPCLYHHNDRTVSARLAGTAGLTIGEKNVQKEQWEQEAPIEMLSNDSTNIYLLPDGSFEMFTVALKQVPPNDKRYIPIDNAPGMIRQIARRTSKDGLTWSSGQIVITPDDDDAPGLQNYGLSVTHTEYGRIGLLGHYRADEQTLDIEYCFSKDGIHWQRNWRDSLMERPTGVMMQLSPNRIIQADGKWWFFYTACNFDHNFKFEGNNATTKIKAASISLLNQA